MGIPVSLHIITLIPTTLVEVIEVPAKHEHVDSEFIGYVTKHRSPLNVEEILILDNPHNKQSSVIAIGQISRVETNKRSLDFIVASFL
jgi:hypothetical protein